MTNFTGTDDLIARWESGRGKHWVNLYQDSGGCFYRCTNGGGNLGQIGSEVAIREMERRVYGGLGLMPDTAVVITRVL